MFSGASGQGRMVPPGYDGECSILEAACCEQISTGDSQVIFPIGEKNKSASGNPVSFLFLRFVLLS